MNEHAAPRGAGGFLFEFRGKHPLREAARWVTGVGLAGVGVSIAVIGTASNSYLSMPLGIATTVLGAIVLFLHAVTRHEMKHASALTATGKRYKNPGKVSAETSIASQLALSADLYSQGSLTPEEFTAAKRRVLSS